MYIFFPIFVFATSLLALLLAYCCWSRLLADHTVFSSVTSLLLSVQDQGEALPRSVLRSALYLLAATQDKSPNLEEVNQNTLVHEINIIPKYSYPQQFCSVIYKDNRVLVHCGFSVQWPKNCKFWILVLCFSLLSLLCSVHLLYTVYNVIYTIYVNISGMWMWGHSCADIITAAWIVWRGVQFEPVWLENSGSRTRFWLWLHFYSQYNF